MNTNIIIRRAAAGDLHAVAVMVGELLANHGNQEQRPFILHLNGRREHVSRALAWREMVVSRFRAGLMAEESVISELAERLLLAGKT